MPTQADAQRQEGQRGNSKQTTDGRPALSRRQCLTGLGAAGAAGLAGCLGSGASRANSASSNNGSSSTGNSSNSSKGTKGSSEEVTILLTPSENPAEVKQQYMPMVKYLENQISGLSLSVDVATDYAAIWPAIRSGQAQIAFDDVTLISVPDKVDVLGTSVTSGTAYYFSMMLTLEKYDISSLANLEGKLVSFCDPISTSGSIYPLYALKQAGLEIGEAPSGNPTGFKGQWSSHDTSIQQLINRPEVKANGNSAKFGIPHLSKNELPQRVRKHSAFADTAGSKQHPMNVLWISEKIPKQPVIAPADWTSPMRKKIRSALASLQPADLKQYTKSGTSLPFTGMRKTNIDAYRPIIERVNAIGIELRQG
jgi:phosphonate transport system substrate-binding protein